MNPRRRRHNRQARKDRRYYEAYQAIMLARGYRSMFVPARNGMLVGELRLSL